MSNAVADDRPLQRPGDRMPGARDGIRSRAGIGFVALLLLAAAGVPRGQTAAPPPDRVVRLHGLVEPVRSYTVAAPRLAGAASPGGGISQLIVVRLVQAGTFVKRGDLLVEFDRHAQLKNARDREAEYRDILEQINKKRAEQITARAMRDAQLKQTENDVRSAELGVLGNEMRARRSRPRRTSRCSRKRARGWHSCRKTNELRRPRRGRRPADSRDSARTRQERLGPRRRQRRHACASSRRSTAWSCSRSICKSGTMAEMQEGEEVRAGHPHPRRRRSDRDARARQRQPGGRGGARAPA